MAKPRLSEGKIPFQLGIEVAPTPPVIELPYEGNTMIYDQETPTGTVIGGTILDDEYIYAK